VKTSALNSYFFSSEARKGMVSSKRWKVSTTMILAFPLLRYPSLPAASAKREAEAEGAGERESEREKERQRERTRERETRVHIGNISI